MVVGGCSFARGPGTRSQAHQLVCSRSLACAGKVVGGWSVHAREGGGGGAPAPPPVDEHGALLRAAARFRGDQGLERRRPGRDPVAQGGLRPGESASAWDICSSFPTGDRLGISLSREERGLMRAFGCGSRFVCTAARSSRGGTTAARNSSSPAAR